MSKPLKTLLLASLMAVMAVGAYAAELNCHGASNVEEFHYTWRLRGGLSWVAGFVFPTNGIGQLKTTWPHAGATPLIDSSLLITPTDGRSGFYVYQSQMDSKGDRTLMTYHGYAWGNKSRKERTVFDYVKRLARLHKETPDKSEDRVQPIPHEDMRDVLTAIYYLRENAATIKGPVVTSIYSDGHEYSVMFRPTDAAVFTVEDKRVNALGFEIVDAPGGKKWPGGMRVWLSDDSRRIPFRIELRQTFALMQLDLQSIESCAFMQAGK